MFPSHMLGILKGASKEILCLRLIVRNLYRYRQLHGFRGTMCCYPCNMYKLNVRKSLDRMSRRLAHDVTNVDRVEVIHPGGLHGAKSVLLVINNNNYLFNIGESTWRYLRFERSQLMPKLSSLFITHNTWTNTGGFNSWIIHMLILANRDKTLCVHAPPLLDVRLFKGQIDEFGMAPNRNSRDNTFWGHGNNTIKVDQKNHTLGRYTDDKIHVDYVPLQRDDAEPETPQSSHQSQGSSSGATQSDAQVNELRKRKQDIALSFIVTPHKRDGRQSAGPIVVLDCPSVTYLDSLVTSQPLLNLRNNRRTVPDIVVHMSPTAIVDHPDYQKVMKQFGDTTKHLMLNERSRAPIFHNSLNYQHDLTMLNPNLFPPLGAINMIAPPSKSPTEYVVQGEYNLVYCYGGHKRGFHWVNSETFYFESVEQRLKMQSMETVNAVAHLREQLKEFEKQKSPTDLYPEVVFLGTSGTVSSAYRNVTCILVHTSADSCIILDCGEGSIIQLLQYYGDKTDEILCKLKAIFISHIHLDHHGGVIGLIEARAAARKRAGLPETTVYMVAPYDLSKIIARFSAHTSCLLINIVHVISHRFFTSGREKALKVNHDIKNSLHLAEFNLVPVQHASKNSYGIILVGQAGWKLVFSGDTVSCNTLIEAGRDCDLLIHEATFDNERKDKARVVFHSTVGEAISVGKAMNAKYVILTHFSTDQGKIPSCVKQNPRNVGVAFDFMRVTLADLPSIQLHEDALLSMFREQYTQSVVRNKEKGLRDANILAARRRHGLHADTYSVEKRKLNMRRKYFDQELQPSQVDSILEMHASRKDTGMQNHGQIRDKDTNVKAEIQAHSPDRKSRLKHSVLPVLHIASHEHDQLHDDTNIKDERKGVNRKRVDGIHRMRMTKPGKSKAMKLEPTRHGDGQKLDTGDTDIHKNIGGSKGDSTELESVTQQHLAHGTSGSAGNNHYARTAPADSGDTDELLTKTDAPEYDTKTNTFSKFFRYLKTDEKR